MADWIKELTPEFYILVGFLFVIFIMLIVQIIRLSLVARRLGTQDFKITEAILKDDDGNQFLQITVINQAFSTNSLNTVGFKNKSTYHVLSESNTLIPPRNKHVETFPLSHIESITIEGKKRYKKIRIYAENDLGDRKEIKGKVTNQYLKRRFKENKKAHKLELKRERFETGNYNFRERLVLILKLFGRPFYKLHKKITRSTNNALKESEVRRKQKSEHDKIEHELNKTAAKAKTIKIEEESKRDNKTRETELELLKQQKVLEIEKLKQAKIKEAYEIRKAEIEAIDVNKEVDEYFEENPIDYNKIDEKILENAQEKGLKEEDLKKEKEKEAADKKKAKPAQKEEKTETQPKPKEKEETKAKEEPKAKKANEPKSKEKEEKPQPKNNKNKQKTQNKK